MRKKTQTEVKKTKITLFEREKTQKCCDKSIFVFITQGKMGKGKRRETPVVIQNK